MAWVLKIRCPEDIHESLQAEGLDDAHLHQVAQEGLAVRLYAEHRLSLGKAAELARMPMVEFMDLLRTMGLAVSEYGEQEYEQDLATIASLSANAR